MALNLIFITPHIVYSDEKLDPGTKALSESFKISHKIKLKKLSQKVKSILNLAKDYNMSIDKEFQIRKNLLNCADENISDNKKSFGLKGNELLNFLFITI